MGQGGQANGAAANPNVGKQYGTEGAYALTAVTNAYVAITSAKAEAEAHKWNARVAEIQAGNAIQKGVYEANQVLKRGRRAIGSARAGLAAQNVLVDADTANDVVEQTHDVAVADAEQVKANAYMEAWGYRVEAGQSRLKAATAKRRGVADAAGGFLSAGAKIGEYQDRMTH